MNGSHASSGERGTKIVIGSMSRKNAGAINIITRSLVEGLSTHYVFIPHFSERKYGLTATANLNPWNLLYFTLHFVRWCVLLLRNRPAVAHYPVTSFWNLEKSMAFLVAARLCGARTVGHLNGGSFDNFWERLGPLRTRIGRWYLRGLDAFVVTGTHWKDWSEAVPRLAPERVHIVTNPIDRSFEEEALAFEPTADASAFFVGSLGRRKGVYDILESAILLRTEDDDARISLSGPEDRTGDLDRIRGIIRDRDLLNVELLPAVYGEAKIRFFRDHGIFLFPSHNENFPLVVLEAAASGRAIITTRVGALPEFFRHEETLLYVTPGNAREISEALQRVRADQDLRARLGTAARRLFRERLANSRVFAALDGVYRSILGPSAR